MAFGRPRKKKQNDTTGTNGTTDTPSQPDTAEAAAAATSDAAPAQSSAGNNAGSAGSAAGGTGTPSEDTPAEQTPAPAAHVSTTDYDRAVLGPYDASEQDTQSGYIDLGALRIRAAEGLQLRLEVEERSKRVIAVTLDLAGSTLQLQAFAAPRTEGLWDEIREQIGTSVGSQGGSVEERPGVLGTELLAKVPARTPDGQAGLRVARFVGVNGPRWFLRGVFGGPAALLPAAAAPVEQLFRSVVVIRGDHPLPPRELLQLRLPNNASAAPTAPAAGPARKDLFPLERGPEITETR